jgi:hypothetical protein
VVGVALVGCAGENVERAHPRCGQDKTALAVKDLVERVGGLRTDDWVVKLAQGTELGVVVLVEGDIDRATPELVDTYGVALVEPWQDGMTPAEGLARVREIVQTHCG